MSGNFTYSVTSKLSKMYDQAHLVVLFQSTRPYSHRDTHKNDNKTIEQSKVEKRSTKHEMTQSNFDEIQREDEILDI